MNEDSGEESIALFKEAMSLVDQGRIKDALEFCGNMRLDHRLFGQGQASRTIVNLLVILLNAPGEYDRIRFAEGALLLIEVNQASLQMEEQASKVLVERLPERFAKN